MPKTFCGTEVLFTHKKRGMSDVLVDPPRLVVCVDKDSSVSRVTGEMDLLNGRKGVYTSVGLTDLVKLGSYPTGYDIRIMRL